ncbi:MAG: hypothetical protein JST89_02870 [Cyanobacteria bacterium SZAS-4]|nr:hypothetical protein [Cyanobacteria bacterium SZAS-4]
MSAIKWAPHDAVELIAFFSHIPTIDATLRVISFVKFTQSCVDAIVDLTNQDMQ